MSSPWEHDDLPYESHVARAAAVVGGLADALAARDYRWTPVVAVNVEDDIEQLRAIARALDDPRHQIPGARGEWRVQLPWLFGQGVDTAWEQADRDADRQAAATATPLD